MTTELHCSVGARNLSTTRQKTSAGVLVTSWASTQAPSKLDGDGHRQPRPILLCLCEHHNDLPHQFLKFKVSLLFTEYFIPSCLHRSFPILSAHS